MSSTTTTARPVSIAGLSKQFGALTAVADVSLDVAPGEFLTLLGPSGSGKTTLLMMIAGFTRPSAGSIRIGGQDVTHLPPHRREIGMVFQNYALFPHMNVGENVAYPLRLRGIGRAGREARALRALDMVQLPGLAGRRIGELSGGQRQRVALARAIVFEPRILLMDEPLSALDKQLREQMQIEIRRWHDRLGMTTISVTHDQREALTMSDRIAVFAEGRLAQLGRPGDLYERPASRFVAEFIGESSFLPLTRAGGAWTHAGQPLQLAEGEAGVQGSEALLMLRPEQLVIAAPGSGGAGYNRFSAEVTDQIYQGDSLLLELRLDSGAPLRLRLPNRRADAPAIPPRGGRVELLLHRADTRLIPAGEAA